MWRKDETGREFRDDLISLSLFLQHIGQSGLSQDVELAEG